MSENVEEVKGQVQASDEQQQEEVYVSPVEEEARAQGWLPKDKWIESGRPEEEWRSAKEFVERGNLFKTIHATKRELQNTKAALIALQKHHEQMMQNAYERAREDLLRERRIAMRDGDEDRLSRIESEMEELDKKHEQSKTVAKVAEELVNQPVQGPHPDFVAWVNSNPWYESDLELREFADYVGLSYARRHPELAQQNPKAVLEYVSKRVRSSFPDRFGGERRAAHNPVSSTREMQGNRSAVKLSKEEAELTETERQIMNTLVQTGVMTKEQYIEELKKYGKK